MFSLENFRSKRKSGTWSGEEKSQSGAASGHVGAIRHGVESPWLAKWTSQPNVRQPVDRQPLQERKWTNESDVRFAKREARARAISGGGHQLSGGRWLQFTNSLWILSETWMRSSFFCFCICYSFMNSIFVTLLPGFNRFAIFEFYSLYFKYFIIDILLRQCWKDRSLDKRLSKQSFQARSNINWSAIT